MVFRVLLLKLNALAMIVCVSGDQPLADNVRQRLRRVRAAIAADLDPDAILDILYSAMVITNAELQTILNISTKEQKCFRIIDVLLRGSEVKLQCFKDILELPSVNMRHIVTYINTG